MAKIGDEVWTVIVASYGTGAVALPEIRVDFVGLDKEAVIEFTKSALENFFYIEGYYSDFPSTSAAVNAFVDGSSTNFDLDVLNWQNDSNDSAYLRWIGEDNKVVIKMKEGDRGEIQFDCFIPGYVLKQSLVIQRNFIEK